MLCRNIRIIDIDNDRCLKKFMLSYPVNCIAKLIDSKLVLACDDKLIRLFNLNNGKVIKALEGHRGFNTKKDDLDTKSISNFAGLGVLKAVDCTEKNTCVAVGYTLFNQKNFPIIVSSNDAGENWAVKPIKNLSITGI